MEIARTVADVRKIVKKWKNEDNMIGLVPTMGFLHEGHASLIKKAVKENDKVIVSDFVNPIQFGEGEDLESYPRDFETDTKLCEKLGVDVIFYPEVNEMYHEQKTYVNIEELSKGLCGSKRPVHFRGVCTVVSKLFNITKADRAYFGQKDAQQLAIIKKMVEDLNFDIKIVDCPIVREADGLAMSSRNTYLNTEERKAALCLIKATKYGERNISKGMKSARLIEIMSDIIKKEPLAKIDYIEVVDKKLLQSVEFIEEPVLVAMAVYIGKTRLIDNFSWDVEK
ncbi:pantoate--beta-alanine ligase [Fusobacterium simiae]|uniref:Pantothenate synthetase n=1 Tax=Fusobacterium simiae TaxID=855 RepID=A0ABT4DHG6_FUSSI|nr:MULTISPECIES: pantoate--beta-alanine ligase [Fusobacterium]MCY7008040.1 pantoate--beta-alanine ligase [Fusobacterium simiae]MDC7955616.1 pantoate--beta-alanine ligase [Fusobacterium simiae]